MSYFPPQGYQLTNTDHHHKKNYKNSHKHKREDENNEEIEIINRLIVDNEPSSTTHIIPQKSSSSLDPGRSYVLNIHKNEDSRYKYIQIIKKSNLIYETSGKLISECLETGTTLLMVVEFIGDNNDKVNKYKIAELNYTSLAQLQDHDLTVGDNYLVASYRYVVFDQNNILNNTLINTQPVTQKHRVVRFELGDGCKKTYEFDIIGMTNLRLISYGQNTYLTGTGNRVVYINGIKITSNVDTDLVVALIDKCGEVIWAKRSNTTSSGNGLLSNLVVINNIGNEVRDGSLNNQGDGFLLITGNYTGKITLDQNYEGNEVEALWWAEIDNKGCWIRSGVLRLSGSSSSSNSYNQNTLQIITTPTTPTTTTTQTTNTTNQQINHLRGYSIVGDGDPIHIAGTFNGTICDYTKRNNDTQNSHDSSNYTQNSHKPCDSCSGTQNIGNEISTSETKPLYYQPCEAIIPVDANISDLNYDPTPGVTIDCDGSVNFHTYFDTYITVAGVRNRNKGAIGLAIIPIPTLTGDTDDAKYIEHGNNNPKHGLVSNDTSYIGGNVYLSGNRVHGFANTF